MEHYSKFGPYRPRKQPKGLVLPSFKPLFEILGGLIALGCVIWWLIALFG
jgi:hypothetical protein